jgi:hypothetical protein
MTDRIRFISHEGKQILLIDFSNCAAAEVGFKSGCHIRGRYLAGAALLGAT